MFRDPQTEMYEGVRESLEKRGVRIVESSPPQDDLARRKPRLIRTNYYAYGSQNIVKTTWSAYADFAAKNAFYKLSQNEYGAGVVEIVDTGNYEELCSVLTRDIEGNIATVFKRDPKRPKLLLTGWTPKE